jgi:hypothetical protein
LIQLIFKLCDEAKIENDDLFIELAENEIHLPIHFDFYTDIVG